MAKAEIRIKHPCVGRSQGSDKTPGEADRLRLGLVVYVVVYDPGKTRFLMEAEAAGATTMAGIDMLVWQGALAFEKWTGLKATVELRKQEAIKLL